MVEAVCAGRGRLQGRPDQLLLESNSADFTDAGRRIGRMGLPTVFCFEGGYAIEAVGVNTVNVLEGFLDASG